MDVKIKLHPDVEMPKKANPGDAGFDLVAKSRTKIGNIYTYHTGVSLELPDGYVGLVYPRSSLSKYDLSLCNSVGVIDSGYRGEIVLKFRETVKKDFTKPHKIYDPGDRICQLVIVPIPEINFITADKLEDSVRGTGGFGSSGQ